ncbi:MAG TPA: hypothetical protein PLR63_07840 [Paludibacteraceae bacterium]|nr:hypothetical protein [Paludibacteraceae bacterium]
MKRVPDEYSKRIYGFRVTEREYALIKRARERGIEPREVMLKELRKLVENENLHRK